MKGNLRINCFLFRKEQWTVRFHLTCLASSQVAFTFPSCYENIYYFSTRWFLIIGCDISICAWFNKGWTCLNLFIYISYLREYLFNNNENDKCSPELINYIFVNNRLGEDQVTVQESSNLTFDTFCWLYSNLFCVFLLFVLASDVSLSQVTLQWHESRKQQWILVSVSGEIEHTASGIENQIVPCGTSWPRFTLLYFILKILWTPFIFPLPLPPPLPQVTSWPLTSAARLRIPPAHSVIVCKNCWY